MPVSGTSSGEVCFNTASGAIKALKPMKTKGVV
jgi:hypothetical protein